MRRRSTFCVSLALVSLSLSAFAHADPVGRMVAHGPIFLGNAGIGAANQFVGLATLGEDGRVGYGISAATNTLAAVNTWNPAGGSTASVLMPTGYYPSSVVVASGGATYAAGQNYATAGTTYVPAYDLYRASGAVATPLSAGLPQGSNVGTPYVRSADGSSLLYQTTYSGSLQSEVVRYDLGTGGKSTVFSSQGYAFDALGSQGVGPGGQYGAVIGLDNFGGRRSVVRRNANGTNTTITSLLTPNLSAYNWDDIYNVGTHAVDSRGNVAFAAKAPGADIGIYVGSGGALTKVAQAGDSMFNTLISGAEMTADGRVVFAGRDKLNVYGIYMWNAGVTTRLAQVGDSFLDADGHPLVLSAYNSAGVSVPLNLGIDSAGDVVIGGIFTNTGNPIGNYSAVGMAMLAAPVPEPASFAVLAVGMFAVLRQRRR